MPTHLLGVIVAARCRNGPSIDFLDQLDLTIEIETETIDTIDSIIEVRRFQGI